MPKRRKFAPPKNSNIPGNAVRSINFALDYQREEQAAIKSGAKAKAEHFRNQKIFSVNEARKFIRKQQPAKTSDLPKKAKPPPREKKGKVNVIKKESISPAENRTQPSNYHDAETEFSSIFGRPPRTPIEMYSRLPGMTDKKIIALEVSRIETARRKGQNILTWQIPGILETTLIAVIKARKKIQ